MTAPQLKEAVDQGAVIEREYTFGVEPKESSAKSGDEDGDKVDVQLKFLPVGSPLVRMGKYLKLTVLGNPCY